MGQSRKMSKKRRSNNLHSLNVLMESTREALMHDLASADMQRLCSNLERGQDHPTLMGWPPYAFKKYQQIRHFDKRIIWPQDKSFRELADEAYASFAISQNEFGLPEPLSQRASLALHHAANICQLILGEFDYDRWFDCCSYGKRAAFKLPRREAYLDKRVKDSSGTAIQTAAFNEVLARDVHLLRAVRSGKKRKRKIRTHIKGAAVPKSWKAARLVFPDTVLGGFLSRGLGEYFRSQLEGNTDIDLSKQQDRHRRWAKEASVTGHRSTIDMRKASDSFVRRHIEVLVPRDWHHALDVVHTPLVDLKGFLHPIRSFMLMGSGHTFPLQTLLFYCLAEATRTLLNCRGKVSVYGDDIIVPTRMSTQFIDLMSELGFQINSEKSFFDSPDPDHPSYAFFRESCGGDYKGGVDVRPYMPECDLQSEDMVPRNLYLAWCHKMINGLLDRWDSCEITITLRFLLQEINNMNRPICFVPEWEVDHSGIKHFLPESLLFNLEVSRVSYEASHPTYWRLTYGNKKRKRNHRERAYQWYSYFLKRHASERDELPFLYEILHLEDERRKSIESYEPEVSLNGEPIRSRKGEFRWTKFGSKGN